MLKSLAEDAEKSGSTVIVHLVLDAGNEVAHRRLTEGRGLDEAEDNGNAQQTVIPGYMTEDGEFVRQSELTNGWPAIFLRVRPRQ